MRSRLNDVIEATFENNDPFTCPLRAVSKTLNQVSHIKHLHRQLRLIRPDLMNSIRLAARYLKSTQPIPSHRPTISITKATATSKMSTFTLPGSNLNVNSIPDLSEKDLLSFPAFKTWITTLQHSLARQEHPSHEFHSDPYVLRKIDIQSVDRFGGGRLGFIKLKADVSNSQGETLPGSVFLRGGSVGMLVSNSCVPFLLDRKFFPLGSIS